MAAIQFQLARRRRIAFTIVELLVVVFIVSALVAMLLPAIQAARERARRVRCTSNIRQIALGIISFNDTHRTFPEGGWGSSWIGIPSRGSGQQQPGGWVYRVLPFLEENVLISDKVASDTDFDVSYLSRSPSIFQCGSRRAFSMLPAGTRFKHQSYPLPLGQEVRYVARGDYAINSGASHVFFHFGPSSIGQGDTESYWESTTSNKLFTGISHMRRSVRANRISDGISKTYLLGEKFLAPVNYEGDDSPERISPGDDDTLYSGYDYDNHRFVASMTIAMLEAGEQPMIFYPPKRDSDPPLTGTPGADAFYWYPQFGSAHPETINMGFCDGSVRSIAYAIEPFAHYLAGRRNDGELDK